MEGSGVGPCAARPKGSTRACSWGGGTKERAGRKPGSASMVPSELLVRQMQRTYIQPDPTAVQRVGGAKAPGLGTGQDCNPRSRFSIRRASEIRQQDPALELTNVATRASR
jgi:hypothetical protein